MSHRITLKVKILNPDLFASIVEQEIGFTRLPLTARFWDARELPAAVLAMGRRRARSRAMLAVERDGTLHVDSDYRAAVQRCLAKYATAVILQAAQRAEYPVHQEQRSDGTLVLRMEVG